jgi:hypothetical protein
MILPGAFTFHYFMFNTLIFISDGRSCLPNGRGDGNNAIKYMNIDGMQEL